MDFNEIDNEIITKVRYFSDSEEVLQLFQSSIRTACKLNKAFYLSLIRKFKIKQYHGRLTNFQLSILRKKVLYQRTINNTQLRQERKSSYIEGKQPYQSQIQYEKLKSWKKYCTIHDGANPWKEAKPA